MDSNLRVLLDKIYELEGLVHLALKRDDSSEDFLRLISKKGEEVAKLCNCKENTPNSEVKETTAPGFFDLEEYSLDDSDEEEKISKDSLNEIAQEKLSEPHKENPVPYASQRGKLVFSINERFRYRKELFNNSDVDFNNTLALVASMEDYEEAEDYFINEEGFEKSSPVVKEFLGIIKNYFK